MKKFLLLLATSVLFLSCAEQFEYPAVNETHDKTTVPQIRSVDQAIEIANEFLSAGSVGSRSNSEIKVSNVILSDITRSAGTDTLIYALDIENNNGFVLVAAPKNVEPILAVIDEGSFNDPKNLENKSYQMILEETKDYVANLSSNRIPIDPDPIDTTKMEITPASDFYHVYIANIVREPLVNVQWGQSWPENIFCENSIAGCTPIAIAQMLSYFELPKSINYTFPGKDISSENLNWTTIKQHKSIYDCYCSYASHRTLARVVREIGQRAYTDYSQEDVSGTYFSNVANAIQQLTGLTPDNGGGSNTILFDDLAQNVGIAIIAAGDHCFIADAIKHIEYKVYERSYNPDGSIKDIKQSGYSNTRLIHYNWGWDGNCNGYFWYDSFNPSKAYQNEYDNKQLNNTSSYNFTGQKMYYYLYKSQR